MFSLSHNYEQRDPVVYDCLLFIWFVSNFAVMRKGNPAVFADLCKPFWIGGLGVEMIHMTFYS